MSLFKYSQSTDLSFTVPDDEKAVAKNTAALFDRMVSDLDDMDKYLDLIFIPFSDHENISEESVMKYRGFILRFKNKILSTFKNITKVSLLCIRGLNTFSSDPRTTELLNSFIESFGELHNKIKEFEKILKNFKSKDFRNNVTNSIKNIKKDKTQLDNLIIDRIIMHINTNILATNWVDGLSQELDVQVTTKEPYLQKLYVERENKLNSVLDGEKK